MSQSQQPSDIPLSNQFKQLNIAPQSSEDTFKVQLLSQQAAYLTKLLPAGYSFQIELKALKRAASTVKNVKEQIKAPPQVSKKSTKDEVKSSNPPKPASTRIQKTASTRITEENENAVYQKYSTQKDYRRNSFENLSQALKPCVRILNLLKNSRTSWPFREPVDPIALGIPHYTQIVKQPMDLSTIENNLRTNQYITPTQFHADVAKIITNSYTFNSSNIQFTRITSQFEAYYRKITSQPMSDFPRTYSQQEIVPEMYTSKTVSLEAKKSKKETRETDNNQSSSQQITMAEKKQLGLNIKKLPKECMKGVLDIVNEGKVKIIGQFDLKELDPQIIRKLQTYVKEKLSGQNKTKGSLRDKPNEHEEESSFEVGEQSQS